MVNWLKELFGNEWRSMDSAPRDGSIIELQCSFGEPWIQQGRYIANDGFHGPVWQFSFGTWDNAYTFIDAISHQARANGASECYLKWRARR